MYIMKCFHLILLSVTAIGCFYPPIYMKLDINPHSTKPNIEFYEEDFDNVFYSYYKPTNGKLITSVFDSNEHIWSPSTRFQGIKYAHIAKKDAQPFLLYLLMTDGTNESDEFFVKDTNSWKKIANLDYNIYITRIKQSVNSQLVALYIPGDEKCPFSRAYNISSDIDYKFVTVKHGFTAWRLVHKNIVWENQGERERCVAVWAYKLDGINIGFIKLLVTKDNDTSHILNYRYNGTSWDLIDPVEWYPQSKTLHYPQNFLYPDYDFVEKNQDVYFPPRPKHYEDENWLLNNDPRVIYLNVNHINQFARRNKEELDDVEYYNYYPESLTTVTKIMEGGEIVWKAYMEETVEYALVAHDNDVPSVIYLLLRVADTTMRAFLVRKNNFWLRTNWMGYNNAIQSIRWSTKYFNNLKLDIYYTFDKLNYDVSLANDYLLFLPRKGRRVHTVCYLTNPVWTAAKGEKCIALWAYGQGFYYLLKLLSIHNGKYKFYHFYRVDDVFYRVVQVEKAEREQEVVYYLKLRGKKVSVPYQHARLVSEAPADFLYPDLPFTKRFPNLDYTTPVEKYKYLYNNYEDFPEMGVAEYMRNFVFPKYYLADCLTLDIRQPNNKFTEVESAVFDDIVTVDFIRPIPGKYFSLIKERSLNIFHQQRAKFPSVGIYLYIRNGSYVLADVLLHGAKPASIYLEKKNYMWKSITTERFQTLLEDLRNNN